ncbi:MAG: MATE family efflux transporter [Candidatus Kapaibacterium sp.]
MQNKSNKLTEGSILKSLVSLSLPIIFINILQTAYQLTDTFWVGRLGTDAVAAVSISFPIIFFIISLGIGLGIAGTILVAQYAGMQDQETVNYTAAQTFLMVIIVSLFLGFLGFFLSPYMTALMTDDADVFGPADSYMKISFLGLVFMFTYMVFQSLLRGVGNVRTPMYVVLGTVLLNLVLDPLLIFGYGPIPAMGVTGAAISTVATQGVASVIGFALLAGGKYGLKIKLSDFKPDYPLIYKMFKIGFPSSIEQSTRALGLTVMTLLVTTFGTLTVAAYGIGTRVLMFVIIPAMGLSMATSTLVGQNIGAGKIDRAEKIAILSTKTAFIALTIVGAIVFIFAPQIVATFIPGEFATIESGALFLRIMALTFGFIGMQLTLNGVFVGSGNTIISMTLAIVSLWVLRFPLGYVLAKHTEMAEIGIWIAFPVSNIAAALATWVWFKSGTWKQKKLTEEMKQVEETRTESIIEGGSLG